ncbi:MFS transporter [Streptomyces sp. Li-HN-5-11]|uniref:MFS transporter n=1 Tax=Streptomyces sp. Li-HN-5-11 TaxID=3075432 RepID=UPI0028AA231C|nr:MFS transporter [Streptomyces sp. Li-HN-5-11]WNM30393.1 MFS transporter [Streptomyces sp. Li-HN-5-11]
MTTTDTATQDPAAGKGTPEPAEPQERESMLGWLTDVAASGPRGLLARQALTSSIGIFLALSVTALYLVGPGGLGSGAAAASLTAASVASLLVTVPVGRLVKRLGPRRFALLSTYSRAALFAMVPFMRAHWALELTVVAIGVAETAAFGVYQIIIVQSLGEAARAKAVAARRSTLNLGFSIAAGLTAVTVGVGGRGAYMVAFLVSAVMLALSALFIHALPRHDASAPSGAEEAEEAPEAEASTSSRHVLRDWRYLLLILVAGFFATSMSLLTVGVPLWVVTKTDAPRAVTGILMAINTILVMLLQVRVAGDAEDLRGARKSAVLAGLGFAAASVVYAVSGLGSALVATGVLVLATVLASLAEMYDSAAWWTISYELAPESHRPEYLAAFDAVTPISSIVGPPLMIGIVALGWSGWLGYGVLFVVAVGAALLLLRGKREESV